MVKYYTVTAKCGHVGKKYFIPIEFAIRADSAKAAAAIARNLPRVKHHHTDAIQIVQEIAKEEFVALQQQNASDPYLRCKNVQEQRILLDGIRDRIVEEKREEGWRNRKESNNARYYLGKKPIRNVKSFLKAQPECLRISIVRSGASVA